ncbi:MAG: hypothetical protein AUG48_05145 [Actinobacteria bacterium 13_1_20CM_3_68_9]|nr:MAG: hypothetical protein AUG48_05145 [Actinobacteria bacterium 13_1_20CM_3_68_9]
MRSHSQQGAVAEIPDEVDELAPVEVARQAVEVPIAPLEVVQVVPLRGAPSTKMTRSLSGLPSLPMPAAS